MGKYRYCDSFFYHTDYRYFTTVKKEVEYIQPTSMKGAFTQPSIIFEQVLTIAKTVKIDSWQGIDRLEVRPSKGIIKIRAKSEWEIQMDTTTGELLKTAYRRSDFI